MGVSMKLFILLLCLGLSPILKAQTTAPSPANDRPVILIGELKGYNYPGLEDKVAQTWDFIKTSTGFNQLKMTAEAPIINFEPFIFAKETPDWVLFQKQWIKDHPEVWDDWNKFSHGVKPDEDGNPFPKKFTAFEYYGTSHIQVNPEFSFIPYYQYDDKGIEQDLAGLGYYSVGHELHHYIFTLMGVPIKLHHCIFTLPRKSTEKPLIEALSDFLIDNHISSFLARFRGSDAEINLNPCNDLSPDEQKAASDWAQKL